MRRQNAQQNGTLRHNVVCGATETRHPRLSRFPTSRFAKSPSVWLAHQGPRRSRLARRAAAIELEQHHRFERQTARENLSQCLDKNTTLGASDSGTCEECLKRLTGRRGTMTGAITRHVIGTARNMTRGPQQPTDEITCALRDDRRRCADYPFVNSIVGTIRYRALGG